MKKSIQGRKWRKDSPIKGVLNEITSDKDILFVEKDTKDNVIIKFHIKENQYALFSEEYKPENLTKDGRKRIDITAFIFEEDKGIVKYYLADVKESVGGKDVVFHLVEQWNAGLKYMIHSILTYIPMEVKPEQHVMVITRKFDLERVCKEKKQMQKELEECQSNAETSLVAKKQLAMKGLKLKREAEILELFETYHFCYEDKGEKIYTRLK